MTMRTFVSMSVLIVKAALLNMILSVRIAMGNWPEDPNRLPVWNTEEGSIRG